MGRVCRDPGEVRHRDHARLWLRPRGCVQGGGGRPCAEVRVVAPLSSTSGSCGRGQTTGVGSDSTHLTHPTVTPHCLLTDPSGGSPKQAAPRSARPPPLATDTMAGVPPLPLCSQARALCAPAPSATGTTSWRPSSASRRSTASSESRKLCPFNYFWKRETVKLGCSRTSAWEGTAGQNASRWRRCPAGWARWVRRQRGLLCHPKPTLSSITATSSLVQNGQRQAGHRGRASAAPGARLCRSQRLCNMCR